MSDTFFTLTISQNWLKAKHFVDAGLQTFSQSTCLCDLFDSSVNVLVLADFSSLIAKNTDKVPCLENYFKLKVYQGVKMTHESKLAEAPSGIAAFKDIIDDHIQQVLAVAAGPHIYIYRKLKPFYKFTLPSMEVLTEEMSLWDQAKQGLLTPQELHIKLKELKPNWDKLTPRSIYFIHLSPDQVEKFVDMYKDIELEKQTVVTCLAVMSKQDIGPNAWDCLIAGTESGFIYILNCKSHTILTQIKLSSVPVQIYPTGSYDVDFHILITCRDGCVYQIKRGVPNPREIIKSDSQIIGLIHNNRIIVIACMDQTVRGFSLKGRPIWSVKHSSSILCIIPMCNAMRYPEISSAAQISKTDTTVSNGNMANPNFVNDNQFNFNYKGEAFYILSFADGSVSIYKDQHLCDRTISWCKSKCDERCADMWPFRSDDSDNVKVNEIINEKDNNNGAHHSDSQSVLFKASKPDPIIACCFGKYDREPNTLVLISESGSLLILIAKRNAMFNSTDIIPYGPQVKLGKLNIPKKSNFFLAASMKEKVCATQMHRQFMHDLYLLKQGLSSTFAKMIETHSGPIAFPSNSEQINISAQANGLGPEFLLSIELTKTETDLKNITVGLAVLIIHDENIYRVDPPIIPVPMVVSNVKYRFISSITVLQDVFSEGEVQVLLINRQSSSNPLANLYVKLPISEPALDVL